MPTPVGYAHCAIDIKHNSDPEPYLVTHGITVDLSTFDAVAHANWVHSAFATAWGLGLDSECAVRSATLYVGQDGGDDLIVTSTNAPVTGQSAGNRLPQNCALLVRKVTGLGGRRNRGRCFVPCVLPEGTVDEIGQMDGPTFTNMQSFATDWLTELESGDGVTGPAVQMVILHRPTVSVPSPPSPTVVQSLQVDGTIATQRRRLRR